MQNLLLDTIVAVAKPFIWLLANKLLVKCVAYLPKSSIFCMPLWPKHANIAIFQTPKSSRSINVLIHSSTNRIFEFQQLIQNYLTLPARVLYLKNEIFQIYIKWIWNFCLVAINQSTYFEGISPYIIGLQSHLWFSSWILFFFGVTVFPTQVQRLCFINKTLPEAKRTQGIEFRTWIIFFDYIEFVFNSVEEVIQVLVSIACVYCASDNVFKYWTPGWDTWTDCKFGL